MKPNTMKRQSPLEPTLIYRPFLVFYLLVCSATQVCSALVLTESSCHRTLSSSKKSYTRRSGDEILTSAASFSLPVLSSTSQRIKVRSQQSLFRSRRKSPSSSTTARHMVLTTPESIIEIASTQSLLDDLIDESVRTTARRPLIMQFEPSSGWIWRRWKGTVFSETWIACVKNVIYATAIYFLYKANPGVQKYVSGFGTLWGQLLSVTTFTLTFFVNQSYALWRKCTELSRRLQGRLLDVGLNMATHAARKNPSNPSENSNFTPAARQILELLSRYIRLFNLLTYASFTRSHRPILTPRGMRRLVERGLMTANEREVLTKASVPPTQRHSVVLMWMVRLFVEGRQSGHIGGGSGFEQQTMEKFHIIRAQYGAIGDELQGRMTLAYAHIVQVLVDLILWMYPIMALSTGMSPFLVIVGTGLLTISYQGLFDLAKQFLDPYDNENYGKGDDPLCIDTLIAETNAGSLRWMYGFEEMPFSAQQLKDGELYDHLLPIRGYSVEELAQMEEDRIKREKEMEEQRLQQEKEEQRRREEAELQQQLEEEEAERRRLAEAEETMEVTVNQTEARSTSNATVFKVDDEKHDITGNFTESKDDVVTTEQEGEKPVHKVTTLASGMPVTFTPKDEPVDEDPDKPVHKVTTLAGGMPVSFPSEGEPVNEEKTAPKEAEEIEEENEAIVENIDYNQVENEAIDDEIGEDVFAEEIDEVAMETKTLTSMPFSGASYLATLSREYSDHRRTTLNENVEDMFVPDMVDYEMFKDLPWFDEVGADGQEYRLSQMLADEDWPEEQEAEKPILTYEEYNKKAAEIIEATENEILETAEIMNAEPGSSATDMVEFKKAPPKYDQTKLDGISQLWGLPPEDPSSFEETQEPETIEGVDFDGVSQLWGLSVDPSTKTDDEPDVGMPSFAGISELWGDTIEGLPEEDQYSASVLLSDDSGAGNDGILPLWHNEIGPDGKEFRLSQMLADEVWEETIEPVPQEPITLEAYNQQVAEILNAAEEELLEAEAILKATPGGDPIGWDEKDQQPTNVMNQTDTDATDSSEEDLDVLEMDLDDELEINGDANATAGVEPSISLNGENSNLMEHTKNTSNVEDEDATEIKDTFDTVVSEPDEDKSSDAADAMDPKASDKIEPIFVGDAETTTDIDDTSSSKPNLSEDAEKDPPMDGQKSASDGEKKSSQNETPAISESKEDDQSRKEDDNEKPPEKK